MCTKEYSICHVTSSHPVEDGRIFRRACRTAAKAGYKTYLVQRGKSYEKDGVHIRGLGEPRKNSRLYLFLRFNKIAYKKALEVDADLYHLHDLELLPYALRLIKKNKKVVFDSHENYVEQIRIKPYLPKKIAVIVSKLFFLYSNYIYRRIDGITYPVDDDYYKSCARIARCSTTTDNLPWLEELYEKYNDAIDVDDNTACYIGSIDEARGVTQMVKAAHKAGCKLYLAGRFSSLEYQKKLENMSEFGCVKYLGVIDRDVIVSLLNKVTVGLSTLLNTGQYYKMHNLPTKVYEYMSMSVPVIMNNSDYNIDINEELGFGICVDPLDIDEYANAIKTVINNKELRKQLGNNGRKAVKEKFCWDREQTKLLKLYENIISK